VITVQNNRHAHNIVHSRVHCTYTYTCIMYIEYMCRCAHDYMTHVYNKNSKYNTCPNVCCTYMRSVYKVHTSKFPPHRLTECVYCTVTVHALYVHCTCTHFSTFPPRLTASVHCRGTIHALLRSVYTVHIFKFPPRLTVRRCSS